MNSNSPSRMSTNLQPRQPPPLSIQDGADGQRPPSSDSNRSLLASLMRSSNLAEELEDSQCSLDDSDRGRAYSRGGGPGATGSVGSGGSGGGAPGPHKLKRQGSSVSSLGPDKDADYSDFSSGRCFHDVAGKTNVLMEDKELYAKFQASLKEKGIKTGVGVKMALQEFVAENVSDADVARFEAAKRQRDLAASGGSLSQSVGGGLSLRERVGSLGSLLQGSRRFSEGVDDPPESLGDANNASWNLQNAGNGLSRSFDPALFSQSGVKKSDSFNNLIGDALGKLGRAAVGATTALPTEVVAGNSTVFEMDNLPPRAAERKKRASFGSLGALSMQKNFIDELSAELSSSDNEEEEKPSGEPSTNPSNKKNDGSRSRGDSGDEESGEDDNDKEYLGDELVVGFGPRPVRGDKFSRS